MGGALNSMRRLEVLNVLHQIDASFEALLETRHDAQQQFGTAIGRLHETMLLIIMRSTDYTVTTSQLLHGLCRGDLRLALMVLQAVIRVPSYEDEAVACAVRLLHGFAGPDAYVIAPDPDAPTTEHPVETFSGRLEAFTAELLRSKLLLQAVPAIASRVLPAGAARASRGDPVGGDGTMAWSPAKVGCARGLLRLVCDLSLLVCDLSLLVHEQSDSLRAELAAASSIGTQLLVPLLGCLADDAARDRAAYEACGCAHDAADCSEAWPLASLSPPPPPALLGITLRAAVLCTFRAPSAVGRAFRASDAACTLAPLALAPGRRRLAGLLLALSINIDALRPLGTFSDVEANQYEKDAADRAYAAFELGINGMPTDVAADLLRAIGGPFSAAPAASGAVGVGVVAAERCGAAAELLLLPVARELDTSAELEGMVQHRLVTSQPGATHELKERLKELEDKASQLEVVQTELQNLAESALPSMEAAFANLRVLQEEMSAGEVVAQTLGAKLGLDLGLDPDAPPSPPRTPPTPGRQGEEVAAGGGGEAGGAAGEAAVVRQSSRFRLLGELPELQASPSNLAAPQLKSPGGVAAKEAKKAKHASRRVTAKRAAARGVAAAGAAGGAADDAVVLEQNLPREFLCGISQNVMRKPLTSPYGHTYEASAIEAWLKEKGQACPLTGQPLAIEEMVHDQQLMRRIQSYHIARTLEAQTAPGADDDDIYQF